MRKFSFLPLTFLFLFVTLLTPALGLEPYRGTGSTSTEREYAPGQVIVKLKPKLLIMGNTLSALPTTEVTINSPGVSNLNKAFGVTKIERVFKKTPPRGVTVQNALPPQFRDVYIFYLPTSSDIKDAVERYKREPDVEYVEPNYIYRTSAVPNDPYYLSENQWGLKKISAEGAWDVSTGTKEVKICILDTGVDYLHPDLKDNIWVNAAEDINHNGRFDNWPSTLEVGGVSGDLDGADQDGNGYPDDVIGYDFVTAPSFWVSSGEDPGPVDPDPMDFFGHGTHCSGIASAVTNNSIGVAGVGWNCRIMAVRAGFSYVDGGGVLFTSDIVNGLTYAADMSAEVISMSFGGGGGSLMQDGIEYASGRGCILVAAAGNSLSSWPSYPGAYDNVIAVGAVDQNDRLSIWPPYSGSNYGTWVDVFAPGTGIYSTLYSGVYYPTFTHTYASWSGTSMATPFVAGLAGLIKSLHRDWTAGQIGQQIAATADNIDALNPSYFGMLGGGRINAERALKSSESPYAKISSPETTIYYSSVSGTIEMLGSANGGGFDHYIVEYADARVPNVWTPMGASHEAEVSNASLESWDTMNVNDGPYFARLSVFSAAGNTSTSLTKFNVENCPITFPDEGMLIENSTRTLYGTVTKNGFTSYLAEWARGIDPEGGWSSSGIILADGGIKEVFGGPIASWTPPGDEGDLTLRILINYGGGKQDDKRIHFLKDNLVTSGWPKQTDFTVYSSPVSDDLDGSGNVKTFAVTGRNQHILIDGGDYIDQPRSVYGLNGDGSDMSGWPIGALHYQGNHDNSASIADINGNGIKEIVVHDKDQLHVFRPDASELPGWPKPLPSTISQTVLCDVDQDGEVEIFAFYNSYLYLFNYDGSVRPGWPITIPGAHYNLVVGDIDSDGSPEVITSGLSNSVNAYKLDGSLMPGFPATMPDCYELMAQPILFDFDNDEALEILAINITASNITIGTDGNYYIIQHNGSLEAGFPKTAFSYVESRPAMGDIDGDGKPEIVAVSFGYGQYAKVYAVNPEDGTSVPGFPFNAPEEEIFMNPAIADVDGDGWQEIIFNSKVSGSTTSRARMFIIRHDGTLQSGWPRFIHSQTINSQCQYSVPAIADIDGDGRLELIEGTSYYTKRHPMGWFNGGAVVAWDLPGASTGKIEWQTFQHDPYHTGVYGMEFDPPSLESVSPAQGSIDQPINKEISAIFNEPIAGRIPQNITNFEVYGTKSGIHLCHTTSVPSQNKIIFNQDGFFQALETVICTIEGGVQDLHGNALSRNGAFSRYTFSFTTSDISLGGVKLSDGSSGSIAFTNEKVISVEAISAVGTVEDMMISEDPLFAGGSFVPFQNPATFELSGGDGIKTVYYKVRNDVLKESETVEATITLDTLPPSVATAEPKAGVYADPLNPVISSVFSDSMLAPDATNEAYFTVVGSISGGHTTFPSYEASSQKVIFNQAGSFLRGEIVTCEISGGVRDKAENPMGSSYSWSFKISPVAIDSIKLVSAATGRRITRSNAVSIEAIGISGIAEEMAISEDPNFAGISFVPFENPATFELSDGDGIKAVYYKLKTSDFETRSISATIELDTTPPYITGSEPASGDLNVPTPSPLSITFNEAMTLEGFLLSIEPAITLPSPTISGDLRTITFGDVPWQINTTYYATFESAYDPALNLSSSAGVSGYFRTNSGDSLGPVIKAYFDGTPYFEGDTISSRAKISARISDRGTNATGVDPSSIIVSIEGIGTFAAATYETSSSMASFNVPAAFEPGTYHITIEAGDLAIPQNFSSATFTVRVSGGSVKMMGKPVSYPSVFKPMSGKEFEKLLRITYQLTVPADINIYLYDIAGNIIVTRKFGANTQGGKAGYNTINWDGIRDFGGIVGNGIYVLKITSGRKVLATMKIVVYD